MGYGNGDMVQTTIRMNRYTKHLVEKARPHSDAFASTTSMSKFFEDAALEKALRVLKDLGIYEKIKEQYTTVYGPIPEGIDNEPEDQPAVKKVDEEDGEDDPIFQETE